jgi:hypothetical protein
VLLIASFFTPALQGYHYTFANLLALQSFVELGLSQVIVQFASHEWSRLRLDHEGVLRGDAEALSRLSSLARYAVCWYAVAAVLFTVGVATAGIVFFAGAPHAGFSWRAPWLTLCLAESLVLALVPFWALLEGCNQVSQVYVYRLGQAVLSSLTVWLAIASGAQLWTASLATTVVLLWGVRFLWGRYGRFFGSLLVRHEGARICWKSEIWPQQWRLALSWMCGYFSFFLFTPVLFHYRGPVVAGQMGMTWSLISALSAISTTWVYAKVPRFGGLIARREYEALDRLAARLALVSVGVATAGAVALECLLVLLKVWYPRLAMRLLSPFEVGLFLLATVLMQVPIVQSSYLRAHRREPMFGLSVFSGVLIGLLTVVLGRRYGAVGVGAAYLSVVALVNVPLASVVWARCRAAWHAPEAPPSSPELLEVSCPTGV